MRNPKVMRLSDADFRLWVKMLAIASENDGKLPPVADLKLVLNARLDHLSSALKRLISGGLIDPLEHGYEPHGWDKFQYKSDTSNERVAKHRAKCNVTVTPPDTDTETDKKEPPLPSAGESVDLSDDDEAETARLAKLEADKQFRADSVSITAEWNAMATATGLPRVSALNDERRAKLRLRLDEHGRQAFTEAIANVAKSPMCRGENSRGWRAGFDFLLQPSSFLKIIEGNYDGTPTGIPHGNRPMGSGGQPQRGGNVRANAAADLYAEAVERERREAEDSVEGGGDYWGTGAPVSALAH